MRNLSPPKEILEKLEIGQEYEVRGWFDGMQMHWTFNKIGKKK